MAAESKQSDDYELYSESSQQTKDPTGRMFANVGALCGLGGVAYMVKNFKNRDPNMKFSVYLIHTRLLAQSTVIGVLTLGMVHQMYTKYNQNKLTAQEQEKHL
eukprot:GFUD01034227.1.p1 GENE.GFUD01034227.1~~GFUD01034227.1.p1  ORF type:complete len:120 (+),score=24.13 GFUD01034227.1:54-362(+)